MVDEKKIQLFCFYDEDGKITELLTGERIIPVKKYPFHDVIDKKTELNIDKYYIKDGVLTQIEGTKLTEIGVVKPTTEEELDVVKQQLAVTQQKYEKMEQILQQLLNTSTETPATELPEDPTDSPVVDAEIPTESSSEEATTEERPTPEDSAALEN